VAVIGDNWIGVILILSSIAMALTIYLAAKRGGFLRKSGIAVEGKMVEKESPTSPLLVDSERMVDFEEASRASEDLKVLNLEREIVSYALTRTYEAEAEGKITQDVGIRLVEKYKAEMRRVDEEMCERQVIVKLHMLESSQEGLAKMFYGKSDETSETSNIMSNLEAIHKEEAEVNAKTPVEAHPARLEGQGVKREQLTSVREPHKNKAEEELESIQEKVLKILERIENIEIET
jgi:hypothetical protein